MVKYPLNNKDAHPQNIIYYVSNNENKEPDTFT